MLGHERCNVQIGEWLGVKAPATDAEILGIVERQLAPAVIKRLIALGAGADGGRRDHHSAAHAAASAITAGEADG